VAVKVFAVVEADRQPPNEARERGSLGGYSEETLLVSVHRKPALTRH